MQKGTFLAALCAALLAACGGSSGGSGMAGNADPGGIWSGTDSSTNQQFVGISSESGQFVFVDSGGTIYSGQATTSGGNISGSVDAFAPFGSVFSDGSLHAAGTFSGRIATRNSMSGVADLTTDNGTASSSSLSLTYDSLYTSGSSLATIAASYSNSDMTATVNANGTFTYQDALDGCTASGTIAAPDSAYDLYQVTAQVSGCNSTDAALNGLTLTGLATYDAQTSPPQLNAGLTVKSGQGDFGVALFLNRN